jgi:hypothetical protein
MNKRLTEERVVSTVGMGDTIAKLVLEIEDFRSRKYGEPTNSERSKKNGLTIVSLVSIMLSSEGGSLI